MKRMIVDHHMAVGDADLAERRPTIVRNRAGAYASRAGHSPKQGLRGICAGLGCLFLGKTYRKRAVLLTGEGDCRFFQDNSARSDLPPHEREKRELDFRPRNDGDLRAFRCDGTEVLDADYQRLAKAQSPAIPREACCSDREAKRAPYGAIFNL